MNDLFLKNLFQKYHFCKQTTGYQKTAKDTNILDLVLSGTKRIL